jgi:hypothetical protein
MNPDSPSRQTLYHTLLDLYLAPTPSTDDRPPRGGAADEQPAAAAVGGPQGGSISSRQEALDLLK